MEKSSAKSNRFFIIAMSKIYTHSYLYLCTNWIKTCTIEFFIHISSSGYLFDVLSPVKTIIWQQSPWFVLIPFFQYSLSFWAKVSTFLDFDFKSKIFQWTSYLYIPNFTNFYIFANHTVVVLLLNQIFHLAMVHFGKNIS